MDFRQDREEASVDPFKVSGYHFYIEDRRRGAVSAGCGVTDVVHEHTGSPAEDFETIARRSAAKPFARPKLANRLKAIWDVDRTPLYTGWNLDRFDRNRGFLTPAAPGLAIDDEGWKMSHLQTADQTSVVRLSPTPTERVAQQG